MGVTAITLTVTMATRVHPEDRLGTILGSLCVLIHLTLTRAPRRGRYYHYSDVINEKTERRKR